MKLISIILFLALLTSCNQLGKIKNEIPNKIVYSHTLNPKDSISFQLDSSTSYMFTSSEYNQQLNIYSFIFGDSLLLYDYNNQKLLTKIGIPIFNPATYTIINKDTIVLLDYNKKQFVYINNRGEKIQEISLKHHISYHPTPITKTSTLNCQNGRITFWGNIGGEYVNEDSLNRKVMGILDIKKGELKYYIPYPKVYTNRNWGGGLFRWVYATYIPNKQEYIISFPADHYVYLISSELVQHSYYAGSRFIDAIYYSKQSKALPMDSEQRTKLFVENNSYANILYDPYNNVYYRIAELRTTYEGKMGWQKDISIIILDYKLNIIGETFIGKCNANYRYSMFVNKHGLHIPQKTTEDILTFKRYELCKK